MARNVSSILKKGMTDVYAIEATLKDLIKLKNEACDMLNKFENFNIAEDDLSKLLDETTNLDGRIEDADAIYAKVLYGSSSTENDPTSYKSFEKRKMKLENKIKQIENNIEKNYTRFIKNNDYKSMTESILQSIKEIEEINEKNKEFLSEIEYADNVYKKAFYYLLGEKYDYKIPYGARRVNQIFNWISSKVDESKKNPRS